LQNLGVATSSLGKNLSSQFLPSVTSMMDGLSALITGDESGFALIKTGINDFIGNLANQLPKFLEMGAKIVKNLATAILDNIPVLFESGVSIITELLTSAIGMLPQIATLGHDLLISLANGIANNLPSLVPTIVGVIFKIVDTLTNPETLSNLLSAALAIITQLAWGLIDSIPALIDSVFVLVDNLVDFLTDPANLGKLIGAAIELVIAIGVGIIKAVPKLLVNVGSLLASVSNVFTNYNWADLGKNLVAGFKNGISNAWKSLKTWFKNLFGDLIGVAKKILGIASPSKVFKKLGGWTAEGFGIGFEDVFSDVEDEIQNSLDFGDSDYGITTATSTISSYSNGGRNGNGTQNVNVTVGIDDSANPMGLARALLPFLKIAEKEAYA
jgi:hypothetical protein